jgi:hypothetical protein
VPSGICGAGVGDGGGAGGIALGRCGTPGSVVGPAPGAGGGGAFGFPIVFGVWPGWVCCASG